MSAATWKKPIYLGDGPAIPIGSELLMENFWKIVSSWDVVTQFVFLVMLLYGLRELIQKIMFHLVILFRGWPPEHYSQDEIDGE